MYFAGDDGSLCHNILKKWAPYSIEPEKDEHGHHRHESSATIIMGQLLLQVIEEGAQCAAAGPSPSPTP